MAVANKKIQAGDMVVALYNYRLAVLDYPHLEPCFRFTIDKLVRHVGETEALDACTDLRSLESLVSSCSLDNVPISDSEHPLVSVSMTTHDLELYVEDAITSVLAQTWAYL